LDNLLLGTSGWSYLDWVGPFYQSEKGMLKYYAQFFRTVEVNSSFYRMPSRDMVRIWSRLTPKDFVFALKVPRMVTHNFELKPCEDALLALRNFLEVLEPLRIEGKLGPLLFQLPPSLEKDVERLDSFLEAIPKEGYAYAVEFRHPSWLCDEVYKVLEKHGVAYTMVDEPLLPPEVVVTTKEFAYVRWHGHGARPWYNYCYKPEELEQWKPKLEDLSKRVEVIYGYFNNHFHAYAVKNCIQLLKLLNMASLEHEKILARMEKQAAPAPVATLEGKGYFSVYTAKKPEDLLIFLVDKRRLERAKEIGDEELNILELSEGYVKAKIRDYMIVVDVEQQTIFHNCADWSRVAPARQFCKHVAKLFLSLPADVSVNILREIVLSRDSWSFAPLLEEDLT